jgi:hypothetical protein
MRISDEISGVNMSKQNVTSRLHHLVSKELDQRLSDARMITTKCCIKIKIKFKLKLRKRSGTHCKPICRVSKSGDRMGPLVARNVSIFAYFHSECQLLLR